MSQQQMGRPPHWHDFAGPSWDFGMGMWQWIDVHWVFCGEHQKGKAFGICHVISTKSVGTNMDQLQCTEDQNNERNRAISGGWNHSDLETWKVTQAIHLAKIAVFVADHLLLALNHATKNILQFLVKPPILSWYFRKTVWSTRPMTQPMHFGGAGQARGYMRWGATLWTGGDDSSLRF